MSFKNDAIFWVEVHKIFPNPYQPRREFDEARLKELSESIRQYGVLQPLVVTRKETPKDDGGIVVEYELIAGERRLRASRLAGIEQVPVIIRDGAESDLMKLELAIIENLQREDLNAIDRAQAFKQLADQFGLSHLQVAQKVGRSREYVSNTMRLLLLPEDILKSLGQGAITEGHARTLLMLNDRPEEQNVIYREILLKKLSVREVERITRKVATDKVRKKEWGGIDLQIIEMEKQLTEALGTRVQIAKTDFGGKVVIDYFSPDDLQKILHMMVESDVRVADASQVPAPVPPREVAAAPQSIESHVEDMVTEEITGVPREFAEEMMHTQVEPSGEVVMETPIDDKPLEEKKKEEDIDLYDIKNFSL